MFSINQEEFEKIINTSIDALPKEFVSHLSNVAFIIEDYPSDDQRRNLQLKGNQTLFGLYEGIPLSRRQGTTKMLPDKITLFKMPLEYASQNLSELRNNIAKTIWHEVAHYYGLDHDKINKLDSSHH